MRECVSEWGRESRRAGDDRRKSERKGRARETMHRARARARARARDSEGWRME